MGTIRKKKLLAIDLGYDRQEINEPLGIDILLSDLEEEFGKIVDITVYYSLFDDTIPILDDNDMVLISTKLTSYEYLCQLMKKCHVPVLLGGALATYEPEYLAAIFPDAIICIGESETNINEIVSCFLNSVSIDEFKLKVVKARVPNVVFFYKGSVFHGIRAHADLTKVVRIPRHYSVERVKNENGLIRMETSRGCEWNKCSFCVMPWRFCGRKWSSFPYEKIRNELSYLVVRGVRQVFFTDEDFIGNKDHILQLCDIIEEVVPQEETVGFSGSTSVRTILQLDGDMEYCLGRMKEAGIQILFIGIESGCNDQLRRFRKGVSTEDNMKAISILREHGFILDPGFIMFDVDTTMDELYENLIFIKRAGLEDNMAHFAKKVRILPNTVLYGDYKRRGLLSENIDLNECCYDYKFKDKSIGLLCHYLEILEKKIGDESYKMQYLQRRALDLDDKQIFYKKTAEMRHVEFQFLWDCVEEYRRTGSVTKDFLERVNEL